MLQEGDEIIVGRMGTFLGKIGRHFSHSSTEISHHFRLSAIPKADCCFHFWAPGHFPGLWLLAGSVLPRAGAASVGLGNVLAGNPGNALGLAMGTARLSWQDSAEPRQAVGIGPGILGHVLDS